MSKKESVFSPLGASNHSNEKRQEEDFYSTQESTVNALIKKLEEYKINISDNILIEPAVGSGNILKVFFKYGKAEKYNKFLAFDIVDRGFPNTQVTDFLSVNDFSHLEEEKTIITNPPFVLAQEFVEHSMELLNDNEYCIMLLKIQFLEGKKRRNLFDKYPPKYVWVFSERQKCLKNDEDNGDSSAICYAWYIWQKGFNGRPTIDWI